MKVRILCMMLMASAMSLQATVTINEVGGWFESGYVTWTPVQDATGYNVYYRAEGATTYTQLDAELVRQYSSYGRADMVGLAAGNYQFKVVPVDASGEMTAEAAESAVFTVTAHDRSGFAHFATASSTFDPSKGIGAYQNDGTLKDGAKVIYVTADNAKTISTDVITSSKGATTTYTGFQNIIDGYQKGYDKTPICFRIVGTVKAENMDKFSSSEEGLQIKGKNAYSELNITIEGIGKDATVHGFGFLLRNACSVELRNFGIMWCMDDAVSIDTDNSNIWVHNLDLFYGQPGSDSDQKKGDGTLDIKGDSKYSTFSYNHLWDNGKASLCGMTSETGPNYLTYHHNWFDHSDSRHPRIRTMSVHVYNNYYDGNSKYGVGSTTGSDVFVENNYFRNCKYPMLTSMQGSDTSNGTTKGTFSSEDGGSIKAYGNYMTGQTSFKPYSASNTTHFDAYVVENKTDLVPATVVAYQGGATYSNFDTDASLMYSDYKVDAAADVPGIVTGTLGAGRCQHGDFSWTFGSTEDTNSDVISTLSTALQNYTSTLVGFYGTALSNGGSEEEQGGGSGSEEGTETETGSAASAVYDYGQNIGTYAFVSTAQADGVTTGSVKVKTNTTSVTGVKFAKSMQWTKGAVPSDFYMEIKPASGTFLAGDSLVIAGAYNNSATKTASIKVVDAQGDSIFNTQQFINGRLVNDDPVIESKLLDTDTEALYLGRNGGTATYILTLQVYRKSASGIEEVKTVVVTSNRIYDLNGRTVKTPQPGQVYLMDGKLRKF